MNRGILLIAIALCAVHGICRADSQTIVGRLNSDGSAEITFNLDVLRSAFFEEWGDGTTITNVYLEKYDHWYLVAEGDNGGECRLMGVRLNDDAGQLRFAEDRVKQKCTGNPCTKCRFTRDVYGEPDGCVCAAGKQCDHTIEIDGNGSYLGNNLY